jgi:hypothetical protein
VTVAVGVGVSAGSSVAVGTDVGVGNGVGVNTGAIVATARTVGVKVAGAGAVITGTDVLTGIVGPPSIDVPIQPPITRNIMAIEMNNIIRPTVTTQLVISIYAIN